MLLGVGIERLSYEELEAYIRYAKAFIYALLACLTLVTYAFYYYSSKAMKPRCPRCSHCDAEVKREQEEQRARVESWAKQVGAKTPAQRDQETRERLFGRQVTPPSEEGSQGGQDSNPDPPEDPK